MGGKSMKKRLLLGFLSLCLVTVLLAIGTLRLPAFGAEDDARAAVIEVLNAQQAAWNRGDVVSFMKGYWNSPELTFSGSSGITRGYEPVLERYRKNYPDQKAMGHLDFSGVEVRFLGNDAALVLGRWHLQRESDELGGNFTLVFERFPDGWKIIHDHTSAEAKKP
jgi:ketosteroid isomerase-like protein